MVTRRAILQSIGLSVAASGVPVTSLAVSRQSPRLLLVVLRGAVDGLALAAPYGDGNYQKMRGELALPKPGESDGVLALDGVFGLHPSLANVHDFYQAGEATVVHAVASPYRDRSHFDGQDLLENGAARPGTLRDGWLNRALGELEPAADAVAAIALAQNTPLILRGVESVSSWAPSRMPETDDNTIRRLQSLYADDPFFATRLEQALRSQEIAAEDGQTMTRGGRGNDARQFAELMQAAARFLASPNGPTIGVVELGGWDTHANQGSSSGILANRFAALDTGIAQFRQGLGGLWRDTVVVVVTEFGRTVRVNGTRGTDHGTATATLVIGGAVHGGRVRTDWPGLRTGDQYAGRDLRPTTDLRSVFKGVLRDHLELPGGFLDRSVFPDSRNARPLDKLIRS